MAKKMTAKMEPFLMPESLRDRLLRYSEEISEPKAMIVRKALAQYLTNAGA
jgi:predicted DNA-binding protein